MWTSTLRWLPILVLAMSTRVASAYFIPMTVEELNRDSDAFVIVDVLSVTDGDPPPPAQPSEGDAGRLARSLLSVRTVRVVDSNHPVPARFVVDAPWAIIHDVLPYHGPSFEAGERLLLALVHVEGEERYRLVADADGKYLVRGETYASAIISNADWRPLDELRVTRSSSPMQVRRGCGGCAGQGTDPELGLALVLAIVLLGWTRRRT